MTSVFETIKWRRNKGYLLLDNHLIRLKNSLNFYKLPYKNEEILYELNATNELLLNSTVNQIIVKITVGQSIEIETRDMNKRNKNFSIILNSKPINKNNQNIYHKTTDRRIYQEAKSNNPNYYDVVFWNQDEQITETTSANIVIKKNRKYLTPKLSCGLLPGTLRAKLLESKIIQEGYIFEEDLNQTEEIYLINSVRGWIKVYYDKKQ